MKILKNIEDARVYTVYRNSQRCNHSSYEKKSRNYEFCCPETEISKKIATVDTALEYIHRCLHLNKWFSSLYEALERERYVRLTVIQTPCECVYSSIRDI